MNADEPVLEEAVAQLELTMERAMEAGEPQRAAEAGVLLGYLLAANGHPAALERAQRAAAVLELAAGLERPLRLAQAWRTG